MSATERLQAEWANRLARGLSIADLETVKRQLENLSDKLAKLGTDSRRHS